MSSGEPAATAQDNKTNLLGQLRSFPRLPLIVGVAVAATVLVGVFLWSRTPDYAVLFSGLAAHDGGDIIARLDQLQEPYRFSAGGSTILVPRADVDRMRLTLAGEGLPKGSGVGFELMDNQAFGVSEFTEKVNYNRALEGELARSVQSIDAISGARVQLAIPQSSVFVRDRKSPSASVILTLYHGRVLGDAQVEAISHLVASAVPGLAVDAVTIVNGAGHLLSGDKHGMGMDNGADTTRLAYVRQIEDNYRQRVQALLGPIVGAGNVRAQVSADVDFSSNESTRENYTPNEEPGQAAVRSEQRSSSLNGRGGVGGVPGALSNQPSPDEPSPINTPQQQQNTNTDNRRGNGRDGMQMAPAAGLASPDDNKRSSQSSSTINYELNHIIEHVKKPVGRLRRLSVAVVINEHASGVPTPKPADVPASPNTGTGAQPGASVTAAALGLSDARMQQITSLVRSAVGYSPTRGDSVEIMQMPFTDSAPVSSAPVAPPWWQDRQLQSLAITALKYLLLAIVALFLWRRLVRPLLSFAAQSGSPAAAAVAAAGPAPQKNPSASDKEAALRAYRRQQSGEAVRSAQDVARNDPRLVAMIVKNWMRSDG